MTGISAGCLLSALEMIGLPSEWRDHVRSVDITPSRVVISAWAVNAEGKHYIADDGQVARRGLVIPVTRTSSAVRP